MFVVTTHRSSITIRRLLLESGACFSEYETKRGGFLETSYSYTFKIEECQDDISNQIKGLIKKEEKYDQELAWIHKLVGWAMQIAALSLLVVLAYHHFFPNGI